MTKDLIFARTNALALTVSTSHEVSTSDGESLRLLITV